MTGATMKTTRWVFGILLAAGWISGRLLAQAPKVVDPAEIEQLLTTAGLEGEIHGSVAALNLFAFTYRAAGHFFSFAQMSLVARDAGVSARSGVLVVEYRDAIVPVFVRRTDLLKDLYRNDVVELKLRVQSAPSAPVHLNLDERDSRPLRVVDSIREKQARQPGTARVRTMKRQEQAGEPDPARSRYRRVQSDGSRPGQSADPARVRRRHPDPARSAGVSDVNA